MCRLIAASIQFKLDTKYKGGAGDALRTRYLNLGNKAFRDRILGELRAHLCVLYSALFGDALSSLQVGLPWTMAAASPALGLRTYPELEAVDEAASGGRSGAAGGGAGSRRREL